MWSLFMTFAIKGGGGSRAPLRLFQIMFFKPCRIVSGLQNYVILCVNAIEIMVWGNVEVPIKTCV